jgi:hypothetical protein
MTESTAVLTAGDLKGQPLTKSKTAHNLHEKPNNGFRWYWLAWAALSLAAFLVPELWVATHGEMRLTLSDTLRAVMGIDPPSKSRAFKSWTSLIFALVIVGGGSVLTMHITAGWPF